MRHLLIALLATCSLAAVEGTAPVNEPLTVAECLGTWAIDVPNIDWTAMAGEEQDPAQLEMMKAMMGAMLTNIRFTIASDSVSVSGTPTGETDTKACTLVQTDANTVSIVPADGSDEPPLTLTRVAGVMRFRAADMPASMPLVVATAAPVVPAVPEEAPAPTP